MQLTDGRASGLETGSGTSRGTALMGTGFIPDFSCKEIGQVASKTTLCPQWTRHTGRPVHSLRPTYLSLCRKHIIPANGLKASGVHVSNKGKNEVILKDAAPRSFMSVWDTGSATILSSVAVQLCFMSLAKPAVQSAPATVIRANRSLGHFGFRTCMERQTEWKVNSPSQLGQNETRL